MKATIFFHTDQKIREIAESLCFYFDIQLKPNLKVLLLNVQGFNLEVRRNPEGVEFGRFDIPFPNNFFEFNNTIEFLWDKHELTDEAISMIEKMLYYFWDQNIPAVAASIYDDRLPYGGGYKSQNLPWPKKISE